MEKIFKLDSISQIKEFIPEFKTQHPLVTFIDFSKIKNPAKEFPKVNVGFYCIVFKNDSNCQWKYGRNNYDFQEGTLIFIGPGQTLEIDTPEDNKEKSGWGLFFHPDLLLGTNLKIDSPDYSFFSYNLFEALHISDKEKTILLDIVTKIEMEISENIDKHSKNLIVSNINLLLNYCTRYYDRQFITRSHKNIDLISEFEQFLKSYFNSDLLDELGIPTSNYCAQKMNLSSNYFSDLLKKETGKSTLEHIHYQLLEKAKQLLLGTELTIREISFNLGFNYPQHFTKLFKSKIGLTPKKFREYKN